MEVETGMRDFVINFAGTQELPHEDESRQFFFFWIILVHISFNFTDTVT